MAAEKIQTPVCEATGLPLPILPTEPDKRARLLYEDYHHHFHPRNDPELKEIEGRAVRYCRGQLIMRTLHDRYHRLFSGPPIPISSEEKFRTTVLACAGVVPRQALDLSSPGEYKIVTLSNDQFERLAAPTSVFVEKAFKIGREWDTRKTIGKFFASYALQQNLQLVLSEHVINQFLSESIGEGRKKELGNFILQAVLDLSLSGLAIEHLGFVKEGFVAPSRSAPLEMVRKYFTKDHYPAYHDELAERIVALAA